jgi:hypothetical protein
MSDHEAIVRATGRRVRRHKAERAEHIAAVVAALNAGDRPTDVADWSAFTAAYVRKLAREAGVPPGQPGGNRPPPVK